MTIRHSIASDEDKILELDNEFFQFTKENFSPFITEENKLKSQQALIQRIGITDSFTCMFVLLNEENIVGYITGSVAPGIPDLETLLECMFITEEYRGLGGGREMVEEFKKWSKNKNGKIIYVQHFIKDKDAGEFYKKMGFVESSRPPRPNHLLLELTT